MRGVIFNILVCVFFLLFASAVFSQENVQEILETIKNNLVIAEDYLHDGKITELRNLMWEEVDPKMLQIVNYIENNLQTIQEVGIYSYEEINLSHGDVKRGTYMFDRVKIDVEYAINDMDFERKIYETKDAVNDLREISILVPEVDIAYSKKNEPFLISEADVDSFSINVKEVDTYSKIKSMNVTMTNQDLDIRYDEAIYEYTNADDSNSSIIIKYINKKIKIEKYLFGAEIYEVFPDSFNISSVIFKSAHAPEKNRNRVMVFSGDISANRTIQLIYIVKSNETIEKLSQTLLVLPKNNINQENVNDDENIIPKKTEEKPTFDDIEIVEKQNYIPYIVLGILIFTFLILVWGNLVTKDKMAKDLEKYRRKINTLKDNV